MLKKGFEKISAYFNNNGMVILVGMLCLVYFVLYFLPESVIVARIFPPLPSWYYVGLGAVVGFYQGITWKSFRFFQGDWYKHVTTWALFVSEFATIMFAASLLSWPMYFIYTFFSFLFKLN